jgi:hypothetical protein
MAQYGSLWLTVLNLHTCPTNVVWAVIKFGLQIRAVEIVNDTIQVAIFQEVLKKQSIISKNLKRYQFGIINTVKLS